jgi:glyceraldehyde 3-phosphate dehydrogenase
MSIRVAINGFGRIGRCVLRAAWDDPEIEFVHINDLTGDDTLAYLLKNDSVHGRFGPQVSAVDGGLDIGGTVVATSAERDPSALPWREKRVDVVLECTGIFRDRDKAELHRQAGAKKVIISAPGKGALDATVVVGVNDGDFDLTQANVVSNASCTTNCLAPIAKVLHDSFGVRRGLMTTIHSYTMDQRLLDAPHPDLRRGRAAAVNMVPTSTGAAVAVGMVLPALAGKLNGISVRVPTPNGSLVDLVVELDRSADAAAVNAALQEAAAGPMKGILDARHAPIVSGDIVGDSHSSIADLDMTSSLEGNMVKVLSWYDNEWGFSSRMVDLTRLLFGKERR